MSDRMNTVKGFASILETKQPLANFQIEVFTVDKFRVIFPPIDIAVNTTGQQLRLGSGITDAEGAFVLSFPDVNLPDKIWDDGPAPNPAILSREWYNLIVVLKYGDTVVHTTDLIERAGRSEFIQIAIPKNALKEMGVQFEDQEIEALKDKLTSTINRRNSLKGIQKVLKTEVDDERSRETKKQEKFINPLFNALTHLPESVRNGQFRYVKPGESVEEITTGNLTRKIRYVFNEEKVDKRPKSEGWLALNENQQELLLKEEYQAADGSFELPPELSQEVFYHIIKNKEDGAGHTTELIFKHPLHKYCKQLSGHQKDCMTALGMPIPEEETDGSDTSGDGTNGNADTTRSQDIQQYIDTQMEYVNSPEGPVLFGVGNRATLAEIEQNVSALSLRPSPADVPAYFDFHSVQLAFEHVWQEAIDEGVLDLAGDAYDEIVNMGGTPPAPVKDKISLSRVKSEVKTMVRRLPAKATDLTIPKPILEEFPLAKAIWPKLSATAKGKLGEHAKKIQDAERFVNTAQGIHYQRLIKAERTKGNAILTQAMLNTAIDASKKIISKIPTTKPKPVQNVDEIIQELEEQLKSNSYAFTTYAANENERSVNFGILITYRQKWEPVTYQAGELVKTIPLAPKEVRRYNKKVSIKRKRIEREIENSLRIIKTDSSETGRAESEIVNKATKRTSFQRNNATSSSETAELVGTDSTMMTNFTGDASRDSRSVKKSFRENVFKAAQEYKNERKVEITTEESFASEFTESGEISNPNDELPVTYMFYELQRRYKVTERIHRLRPVVFVAQEMPKPHEIDEDWILTHDWIIRRILLDDSFLPALNYLGNITSDAFVLTEMAKDVEAQRKLVNDVRISFQTIKSETESRYRALQKIIDKQAGVVADRDWYDGVPLIDTVGNAVEGIVSGIGGIFGFGSGGGDDDKEAARLRAESARDAYEKAEQQQRELMTRLTGETDKLQTLSDKYNEKLSHKLQKEVQIARLKVHLKQNILHYMHGIWSHEHPDQRFFRLHSAKVPTLQGEMQLTIFPSVENDKIHSSYESGKKRFRFSVRPNISTESTTLEKVADLDDLLGFKGNYMIFPLKENNALTDYMMAPYVDQELGLKDPDEFGNWTLDEFSRYVCCLKKEVPEEDFNELIPQLTTAYKKLLMDPLRQGEEIVVPTGSLFIEALPGTHPILEDFKLAHRAIDVKKAQAEVREMELENIRLAARLKAGELDDPDVEKKIIVNGNGGHLDVIGG